MSKDFTGENVNKKLEKEIEPDDDFFADIDDEEEEDFEEDEDYGYDDEEETEEEEDVNDKKANKKSSKKNNNKDNNKKKKDDKKFFLITGGAIFIALTGAYFVLFSSGNSNNHNNNIKQQNFRQTHQTRHRNRVQHRNSVQIVSNSKSLQQNSKPLQELVRENKEKKAKKRLNHKKEVLANLDRSINNQKSISTNVNQETRHINKKTEIAKPVVQQNEVKPIKKEQPKKVENVIVCVAKNPNSDINRYAYIDGNFYISTKLVNNKKIIVDKDSTRILNNGFYEDYYIKLHGKNYEYVSMKQLLKNYNCKKEQ